MKRSNMRWLINHCRDRHHCPEMRSVVAFEFPKTRPLCVPCPVPIKKTSAIQVQRTRYEEFRVIMKKVVPEYFEKHKGIADSCATPVAARSETTNLIPHLQKVGGRLLEKAEPFLNRNLFVKGRLGFPPDLLEKFATCPVGFEIPSKNVDTKEGGRRRSVG
ncbi:hypothetical protein DAPPUDRAFT_116477 [Daphnia pulex]|uniref:Uncharacterized protein n=1 Tax=Daphnia pulex TaxID=6669 RepID=E9HPG3_DAPPU|nr:hypothetical protein DAPPUDRAFT_116477 [Daphnia pulex]|eukprot:EFX66356.1 hypothetical protein DAPPUDRAFT_116477 [Daphnia pulex]